MSEEIDIDAPDAPPGVLALPGKRWHFDFAGGEFQVHGVPIVVHETPNTGLGTGLTVWDGAVVLAKYLEVADLPLHDMPALELGAGTALVGMTASVLGSPRVLLTDLNYTLPNVRRSVAANAAQFKGVVEVAELDWCVARSVASPVPAHAPTHTRTRTQQLACRFHPAAAALDVRGTRLVVGADIVWVDSLIPALVATMAHIADAADAPVLFLVAHQTRSRASDALFFAQLAAAGFEVSPLPPSSLHPAYRDPAIAVLRMTRPPRAAAAAATGNAVEPVGAAALPIP